MQAIQNLCNRTIVFSEGHQIFDGDSFEAMTYYLKTTSITRTECSWEPENAPGNENITLCRAWIKNRDSKENDTIFTVDDDLEVGVEFENKMEGDTVLDVTMHLRDERNVLVFVTSSMGKNLSHLKKGKYLATFLIPRHLLNQGTYTFNRLLFVKDFGRLVYEYPDVLTFDILKTSTGQLGWMGAKEGIVRPILPWKIEKKS